MDAERRIALLEAALKQACEENKVLKAELRLHEKYECRVSREPDKAAARQETQRGQLLLHHPQIFQSRRVQTEGEKEGNDTRRNQGD